MAVELSQRSAVNHPACLLADARLSGDTLWAVVFEGRVRVNVSAPDCDTAVSLARAYMPGLAVSKVYPR